MSRVRQPRHEKKSPPWGCALELLLAGLLLLALGRPARAEIVDRIVARMGGEIITLSDIVTLRRYQALLAEPGAPAHEQEPAGRDDRRSLDQLIEQQLILAEAGQGGLAYTPMSAEAVEAEMARLGERLGSGEVLARRMSEVGLSEEELREVITRQGNILRFLDVRFRAAVELPEEELSRYYRQELLPQLERRGLRALPAFAEVEDQVRELLTQQQISQMVSSWLVELKARTPTQIFLEP